jgi:hypothetical protein
MHFRRYVVMLEVTVTDSKALLKAARESAGCRRSVIRTNADAIQWLLDPGSMFDSGIEIEASACVEV